MAHARTRGDWADRRRASSSHRSRLPKHARSVAAMLGVLGSAGVGAACMPLFPIWVCLVIFVLGAAALVGWFR